MIEKVPVGPTRYRNVVLTSWDRGLSDKRVRTTRLSDCERDPLSTRDVVLTSWDCGLSDCVNSLHTFSSVWVPLAMTMCGGRI